jgi:predicted HicB family RNase H-like nuclease
MLTDHYTYRISWSVEDQEFVATCVEFPSISWLDADQLEALKGLKILIGNVLTDMEMNGETPPAPIAEQAYSGKFLVRVPPELHRKLAMEAAESRISLNRLASLKLAS